MSHVHHLRLALARLATGVVILALTVGLALAAGRNGPPPDIAPEEALALLFPGEAGLSVGPGDTVRSVLRDGTPIAWYGSSYRLTGSVGYSGRPIDLLVAVGPDARIVNAVLAHQDEPILTIGVGPDALHKHVAAYRGVDVRERLQTLVREGYVPDAVSGATISSGVIRQAVLRTGRIVAKEAGLLDGGASAAQASTRLTFDQLVATGRLARIDVSFDATRKALPDVPGIPEGDGTYASLVFGLADNPAIGAALLGEGRYNTLAADIAVGDSLLIVAGSGVFSFKGTQWRRSGVFDRLDLIQSGQSLPLAADDHTRFDALYAEGAPEFREVVAFRIPADSGFKADAPFQLALVIDKTDATGKSVVARFPAEWSPPAPPTPADAMDTSPDDELWRLNWEARAPELAILTVLLATLFAVLYVSGPIVRRPKLYRAFRTGFLAVVLVWLGWTAGAQLSVVHVVSFLQALLSGFRWETFLLDPLIFVLWSFVALGVVFWGRGVFCGWLCPFGALQELLNQTARRLRVPQIEIPWEIHERLWPVKYVALFLIVAVSLQEIGLAFRLAEVEPFKTSITLHFVRHWPFVVFAVAVLAVGLFVERAYCRYLCPLGAALALPSKFKIFDWLIRRPQCGRECRVCERTCTVQAIDPVGRINPNECIYCLRCQVNYWDPETCVPLKMRQRRRQAPAPEAAE